MQELYCKLLYEFENLSASIHLLKYFNVHVYMNILYFIE